MNKPKSLYIHIPFCEKICDYCDFIKLQYFRNFALSYLNELEKELKSYQIGQLDTIYVGGGTPTALEDDLFLQLLKIIEPYSKGVKEYTFEANPESLSESKIKLLAQYGVNRISVGVQSTNEKILKAINRAHSFNDVQKAVSLLKENKITNINVDLILGLPNSNESLLRKDLENIMSLGIKHVSCYALTIHPHTVLYNQGVRELDDDLMRHYYDIVNDFLKEKGFVHYEVSNWSIEGYQSLHNLTYWRNQEYYAVGLGASGYIYDTRYKNTVNLSQYLRGDYVYEKEIVSKRDKMTYQIMLNLRTKEGLDLKDFKEKFDVDLLKLKEQEITELIKRGYLSLSDDILSPTYEGMMTLDQSVLKLI